MDKETKLFYLSKIKTKLNYKLQNPNNYLYVSEILKYLEICTDICELLERKFLENTREIRNLFEMIKVIVKQKDYLNAKELVEIKIKELDASGKQSSSKQV